MLLSAGARAGVAIWRTGRRQFVSLVVRQASPLSTLYCIGRPEVGFNNTGIQYRRHLAAVGDDIHRTQRTDK